MRRSDFRSVYAGLSAMERAIVVVKSWHEGRPHDPDVLHGMSESQATEYNRLIDLMQATDDRVGLFAVHLDGCLRVLSVQLSCVLSIMVCERELDDFAIEVSGAVKASADRKLKKRLEKILRGYLSAGAAAPAHENGRVRLTNLHKDLLAERYKKAAGQLLAVQAFLAEMAAELGGEDPLHPMLRDLLNRTEQGLAGIAESIQQFIGETPVPELDAEVLQAFRTTVVGTDD